MTLECYPNKMAGQNIFWKSFALIITSLLFDCSCSGPVPCLIWTNDRDISATANDVALGHHISLQDLQTKYLKNFLLSTKATIIFLQDKLSFDDLTKYGRKPFEAKSSVFENMEKFLQSNPNTMLPSVMNSEGDASLLQSLKKVNIGKAEEVYSSDIDSWRYKDAEGSKTTLYVFHFLPVKGSTEKGKISTLSRNDDIMKKIISQMPSNVMYTALLTSSEPSDIVEKIQNEPCFDEVMDTKRHLLSVAKAQVTVPGFFNFSDCVYLYASSIKFAVSSSSGQFFNSTYTASGKCASNESTVSIMFTDMPVNFTKFELRLSFKKLPNTDWACSGLKVTYSGTVDGTTLTNENVDFPKCPMLVTAPKAMSYACGDLKFNMNESTLAFKSFQVQPFGVKAGSFSNAYDCVGFFTTPILTGIFVTALLISIVLGGIMAMMGISTMDRFDDPKGPTIQVPHE